MPWYRPSPRADHRPGAISFGGPLQKAPGAPATLPEALQRAALQSSDKGIIYLQADGTEAFQSYPDLLEVAQRVLAGLRKLGLKPQDKVIFQFDRSEDFFAALWGCVFGGFVPVPIAIPPTYDQSNSTVEKLHNAWKMLGQPIVLSRSGLLAQVRSLSKLLNLEHFQVEAIDDLRTQEADRNWHAGQSEVPGSTTAHFREHRPAQRGHAEPSEHLRQIGCLNADTQFSPTRTSLSTGCRWIIQVVS